MDFGGDGGLEPKTLHMLGKHLPLSLGFGLRQEILGAVIVSCLILNTDGHSEGLNSPAASALHQSEWRSVPVGKLAKGVNQKEGQNLDLQTHPFWFS